MNESGDHKEDRIFESLVKIEKRLDIMEDNLSIISQRFNYLSQVDDDIQNGLSLRSGLMNTRAGEEEEEDGEEEDNERRRTSITQCCCPCSLALSLPFLPRINGYGFR